MQYGKILLDLTGVRIYAAPPFKSNTMQYELSTDVQITVFVTERQLDILLKGSRHHYSHDCQAISDPNEPGAFLHGAHNRRNWSKGDKPTHPVDPRGHDIGPVTSRKFQLLLKILEFKNGPEESELFGHLWKTFQQQQTVQKALNELFDTFTNQ